MNVPFSFSISLVDLLSQSPLHSHLLTLLQRARLIPTLNSLKAATLLAPTNQAIAADPVLARVLHLDPDDPDNLHLTLRATLLYHLVNGSLPSIPADVPVLLETLLLPLPPSHAAAPPAPGLLAAHGQTLRIFQRNELTYVAVDNVGKGGYLARLNESQHAHNGVLVPLDHLLVPPPALSTVIRSSPHLSLLAQILSPDILDMLDKTPHLTVFAPHDQSWSALDPVELSYLKSNFSSDDALKVFQSFSSQSGPGQHHPLGYYQHLYQHVQKSKQPLILNTTAQNHPLSLDLDPSSHSLTVNGTPFSQPDILTNNGVLHIIPKLLLHPEALSLSPEKYLLALNCSTFVSLFHAANLSDLYLSDSSTPYTILAPRDNVFDSLRTRLLPPSSSASSPQDLARSLKYHIIRGKYLPEQLADGMLLTTELDLGQTQGKLKQRIPVSVSSSSRQSPSSSKSFILGFGGVNVVGSDQPVEVASSVIYIVSQSLEKPPDVLQLALSDIRLSTCVASIFAAGIDSELRAYPGLSYFVPTNTAFEKLGLAMSYLLLDKSKGELANVLRYHAVAQVVYLRDIPVGSSHRYPTLEGSEIYISKLGAENITLHGPTISGRPRNGETTDAQVVNRRDRLMDTGSLNVLDQVILPASLEITVENLLAGAKASTMLDLIKAANFSFVLSTNNRLKEQAGRPYTVLCPTDEAFTKINLTYYLSDTQKLTNLVKQHIIPFSSESPEKEAAQPFKPLALSDGLVYSTLLSQNMGGPSAYGDVSLRLNSILSHSRSRRSGGGGKHDGDDDDDDDDDPVTPHPHRWIIGIKSGHASARVINYGRVTGLLAGGVLTLDRVLEPYEPSWWESVGKLMVAWAVVVGCVGIVSWGAWRIWGRKRPVNQGYQYIEPMEE